MPDEEPLRREFGVFATYLGARGDLRRGAAEYERAHASLPGGATPLDRALLRFARIGPAAASLADAYARFVRPYGLLRRKLVLALAVLESSAATHAAFDTAVPSGPVVAWLSLAAFGARWAVRTIVAFVVLAPVHLHSALFSPRATDG